MIAKLVSSTKELQQILDLQKQNLRGTHDEAIEKEQGFVTVAHSLTKLQQLHTYEQSVIVNDNDTLAGYALVMTKQCSTVIPELFSMFEKLGKIIYKGNPVADYHFYVMGQICVAAEYRGKGVFDLLYQKHKEVYHTKYNFVITSIATRNIRSIRAHERIGFKIVDMFTDELDEWAVVIWDWAENNVK